MAFVPPQTIEDSPADYGMLDDTANLIVYDSNVAQIIAAEVLNNNFTTFFNIEFSELEDSWKTYISLSVAEVRIRLQPGTKVNIWALFQLIRDRIRLDEDPDLVYFNISERKYLTKRYSDHNQWRDDASNMAKTATPKSFTQKKRNGRTGNIPLSTL